MFTTVTKQLKRALSAAKSVLAIAGTAAAVLDPKLKSYLREGEQLDGLKPVQLTLVRWIEDDHNRLEEQESVQRAALRKLKQMRLHRDERQASLYSQLLRIRKTFEDAFGQGKATIYLGLGPRLGEAEPLTLRRQARETTEILLDPQLATPTVLMEGLWENPVQYAEQIREALVPFQTTLDEIESQKREVEMAQKAKTDLLEQLGERLTWSTRFFEAIYRLADLGFHADRLRLTVSSRPSADKPEGESGEGEGSQTEGETSPESSQTPVSPETSSQTQASAS